MISPPKTGSQNFVTLLKRFGNFRLKEIPYETLDKCQRVHSDYMISRTSVELNKALLEVVFKEGCIYRMKLLPTKNNLKRIRNSNQKVLFMERGVQESLQEYGNHSRDMSYFNPNYDFKALSEDPKTESIFKKFSEWALLDNVHVVKFEEIVEETSETLKRVFHFLDIPPNFGSSITFPKNRLKV